MNSYIAQILQEVEIKTCTEKSIELSQIKEITDYLDITLKQLKCFIKEYEFEDSSEEIWFFKEVKPYIHGQLLYYVRCYHIKEKLQCGCEVSQSIYLNKELQRQAILFEGDAFYCYYREGRTHFDTNYFLRESYDLLRDRDCLSFDRDPLFSTSHDYDVANIIASNLLNTFLIKELALLQTSMLSNVHSLLNSGKMNWTNSKVALVELIYELYYSGSINGGKTSLKDIAQCLEVVFNVEVGDLYRAFLEIRGRKKNRTQFLDQMRDAIIKVMDELER